MTKKIVILLMIYSLTTSVFCQENKLFGQWDASLRISTMGIGAEAETRINTYLKARAGIDYFSFKTSYYNISLEDRETNLKGSFGYIPDYRTKIGLSLIHGHLLADFYPVPTGKFYITGGIYIGSNKLTPDGFLADDNNNVAVLLPGKEWPVLELEGHKIDVTNGHVEDLELRLGGLIKPYLGIGLGSKFGKSKFGYKVELGMLYQGDYSVKQNGIKIDMDSTGVNDFEDIDKYTKWLKWWPMLNFQITYSLF